ncbi:MAG: hypothetical protein H6652_27600 [Ardenticatenaceae bacterium]|nr:hypothetical protein [Ardenticatenaceae bacterium]
MRLIIRTLQRRTNFPTLRFYIPDVLKTMPVEFDSHQFIGTFINQEELTYIHALRDADLNKPFQTVNDAIIHWLRESDLVKQIGTRESENIFKQVRSVAVWRKV